MVSDICTIISGRMFGRIKVSTMRRSVLPVSLAAMTKPALRRCAASARASRA